MPKTLLAVDDSATMRKVLEITFAGEDFRVVSAEGAQNAMAKMSEDPVAAVIDTSLDGADGYALAKDVRSRSGSVAIVLMSSRHNPYDTGRGRDAGADDFIDKPFDTQTLIDKVKKAIGAHEARGAQPAAMPPAAARGPAPPSPQIQPVTTGQAFAQTRSFEPSAAPVPAAAPPYGTSGAGAAPPAAVMRTAPTGVAVPVAPPASGPASHPTPLNVGAVRPSQIPGSSSAPAAAASIEAAANGHLASKLGSLGLTPQQVDAVMALSREVVERVVWEVVPQLAETIIREEIARLTKEG